MGRIIFDAQAVADLQEIHHYIGVENRSPNAADRFVAELRSKLETYAASPEIGTPRSDLEPGVRSFTFKRRWVVVYRPLADGIDIVRVFHGSRDYPALF